MGSAVMSDVRVLSIAKEFTPFPGGRRRKDGPFSGEAFREDILKPSLKKFGSVVVDFDGVAGLPSSFLEEVFGGVVRYRIIELSDFGSRLKVQTSEPDLEVYRELAYQYAQDAYGNM